VEHVKQVNKLWTNDSLFLRKVVDIPVAVDEHDLSLGSGATNEINDGLSSEVCDVSPRQSRRFLFANPKLSSRDLRDSGGITGLATATCKTDVNSVNIASYFSKYDTVLDKAKDEVKQMELRQRYSHAFNIVFCTYEVS